MDSIFYIVLIILFIRFVIHWMKQNKEKGKIEKFGENNDSDLGHILDRYADFSKDEIIESSVGFYLFCIDRKSKDFIFITQNETVYRLSYDNLKTYSIEEVSDDIVNLRLNTTFTQKPIILIECFNRMKALTKMPSFRQNITALDDLYDLEISKISRLDEVLNEIVIARNGISDQPTPPPYIKHEKTEVPPVITIVNEKKLPVESKPKVNKPHIHQEEIIEVPETIEIIEEIDVPSVEVNYIPMNAPEEIPEIKKEQTASSVEDVPGKVRISLEEIEEYSRGKFLDSDIQSIFSDARMRGKKDIYITEEQLENLKK